MYRMCTSVHICLKLKSFFINGYFFWTATTGEARFKLLTLLAGESESMYSLGWGVQRPPPQKKALEYRYRGEMHDHSFIFQGAPAQNSDQ